MWECRTIARSPTPSPPVMRAPTSCRVADGEEVQRRVEVPFPESEVGGGDRRREAVVEGLGQPQPFVNAVPAELDRQLVGPQLAGVEEPEQLNPREVPLA